MKKVLTIAGSDCSGGAGIQADIKTITAHKMYAMSAITALTAQNTTGVYGIQEAAPDFIRQQLDCIFTDIRPDSVKIGMVSSSSLIFAIVEKLTQYQAEKIVVDPVMVSTSGCKLLSDEADMIRAAEAIAAHFHGAILVKGGHLVSDAIDLLYENGTIHWYRAERVNNPNTHGTGCTLSSAIACNLAAGYSLDQSIRNAKTYLTGALNAMLDLGHGSGPLDHTYCL